MMRYFVSAALIAVLALVVMPLRAAPVTPAAPPATAAGNSAGSSTQPAEVTAALTAGKAVALIEITAVKDQDQRPADGERHDEVTFKVVKSSGKVPGEIRIVTAHAYPQMAGMGGPAPVLPGLLSPTPFGAGKRYWVVFSGADVRKYPEGVVAWWPEKDAPAALEAAVSAAKFGK